MAANNAGPRGDWGLTQEQLCGFTCWENGVLGSV